MPNCPKCSDKVPHWSQIKMGSSYQMKAMKKAIVHPFGGGGHYFHDRQISFEEGYSAPRCPPTYIDRFTGTNPA